MCLNGALRRLLKMLIVFTGVPVAAPGKAMLLKQAVTQILFVDFIGERLTPIRIVFSGFGRYMDGLILIVGNIGIVQGVDINGQSIGMSGQAGGARHHPVIEAGAVVVGHGQIVVPTVSVDKPEIGRASCRERV